MDRHDDIMEYLLGKLQEEDKNAFEKEMENNPALKAEVKEISDLREAIALEEEEALRNDFKQLEKGKTKPKVFLWILIPLVLLGLILGSIYFLKTESQEEIYASYYEPFPNALHPIVRGETDKSEKNQIFLAYEAGDFNIAAMGLEQLLKEENNPELRFYYALSLQGNKDYEDAMSIFNELENADFDYSSHVLWYDVLIGFG